MFFLSKHLHFPCSSFSHFCVISQYPDLLPFNTSLDDFIYFHEDNHKKAGYCTPTISTLNEYFSSIENTLLNQKKIKP